MNNRKNVVNTAIIRTVLQNVVSIAIALAIGLITLQETGQLEEYADILPPQVYLWVTGAAVFCAGVSGLVTKLMYIPEIELLINRYAPFLSYLNRHKIDENREQETQQEDEE